MGSIFLVGIGPGDRENMTPRAVSAIRECDTIVGYETYIRLLGDMTEKKTLVSTGMTGEKERCIKAITQAAGGSRVAVICSGDSGVYGMAGLIYELIGTGEYGDIPVEVIPGITAANSGAALLGAPLMNDFGVISLSDQLIPWERICQRIKHLAASDMVMVFYNPMSRHRPDTLRKACDIILEARDEGTVCGWVKNVGRDGQTSQITTLGQLRDTELDMLCTVYIGGTDTVVLDGKMVTTRGYDV